MKLANLGAPPHPFKILRQLQIDRVLGVALILGFLFAIYGLTWGGGEDWNPDSMAFRSLFSSKRLPFEPANFYKPPFHTYFNFFLSTFPFELLEKVGQKLSGAPVNLDAARILWSRLLTVGLFLGSIALVFQMTRRFFGLLAARVITLLFATSAGFIVEAHFLTADMPVLFWMLLAFFFVQNIILQGRASDYLWAGFLTGVATATKYNGLAVGIAIVVAHLLRCRPFAWKPAILDAKLYLGLGMVVVGFVAGNPFALISFQTFTAHFLYNYRTTPVWDGSDGSGNSYGKFLLVFTDIIGWPAALILLGAFLFSLYSLFRRQGSDLEKQGMLLLLSVFLLYYYKFGDFPRIENRFVMPIVPFWMMATGPLWQQLQERRRLVTVTLLLLLGYNSLCSLDVGRRFAQDPRTAAQAWVKQLPKGAVIESSAYTPKWKQVSGFKAEDTRMPFLTGRRALFEEAFKHDAWMLDRVRLREAEERSDWFSAAQLQQRRPDYVATNSLYYERFDAEKIAQLYPSVQTFFKELLAGKAGYKIVFDRTTSTFPGWLYPQRILFVDNRMVILAREGQ